jgi:hypothetical protein
VLVEGAADDRETTVDLAKGIRREFVRKEIRAKAGI